MSKIFQQGSYSTLYGGLYEGTITAEEALKHGRAGIGTLDGADGEVIIWDGVIYHGNSKNQVREVKAGETLPYVAVIEATTDITFDSNDLSFKNLLNNFLEKIPSKNTAYSLVISGEFHHVEITSKPEKNGERAYLDILAEQPHFTKENLSGTIVGIWAPEMFESLYGNGFHLHFISDDRAFGAHLVDFEATKVTVKIGQIDKMEQQFPITSETFQKMTFEK
ncbi:acetolactate decarboxylase [Lactococcus nasutitermitis]|uniref:Alpha-acetolactate decarboxylase n=1 Tax=Lactococcus nasutitermitis TaxID=1652957 RepID=A0ABV9JD20_9LACT|nr:acetolactate decarboxylase [Lactococcus nasutitermitis]